MTDADPNDSSQADDEGTPESDEDRDDQNQYGGADEEDENIDPVEQTERQEGSKNDAGGDDN